ncbi:MAG: hypothetical protein ACXWYD_09625, partial [Candidatus Binatia bacterium]
MRETLGFMLNPLTRETFADAEGVVADAVLINRISRIARKWRKKGRVKTRPYDDKFSLLLTLYHKLSLATPGLGRVRRAATGGCLDNSDFPFCVLCAL